MATRMYCTSSVSLSVVSPFPPFYLLNDNGKCCLASVAEHQLQRIMTISIRISFIMIPFILARLKFVFWVPTASTKFLRFLHRHWESREFSQRNRWRQQVNTSSSLSPPSLSPPRPSSHTATGLFRSLASRLFVFVSRESWVIHPLPFLYCSISPPLSTTFGTSNIRNAKQHHPSPYCSISCNKNDNQHPHYFHHDNVYPGSVWKSVFWFPTASTSTYC